MFALPEKTLAVTIGKQNIPMDVYRDESVSGCIEGSGLDGRSAAMAFELLAQLECPSKVWHEPAYESFLVSRKAGVVATSLHADNVFACC